MPRKVLDLERDLREVIPSVLQTLAPVIKVLQDTQATQAAQQVTLADQQTQLTAQVATLAAQVALQVSPSGASTSASGFGISSGTGAVAGVTFTVPSGYTRALILGSGTVTAANTSGTSGYLYVKVVINGGSGPEAATIVGDFNTAPYANTVMNISASHSATLTGLSGGTFTVQIAARTGGNNFGSSGTNSAMIAAQVIFLR
ncbi:MULTISPECIES: hypothetical protein [unclassified Cryobacterium]|uniref:hypothetical protein n=1 Tax=unclassified Cryobacterium TaxID=2649013 RepID=UPI00106BDB83|nr:MULTISPECIES: hypothetical protein [unclassified Cryobacterium]TFB96517.1 hypothetical protein E3O39_10620 [Cryobacterium sp. MDB2-A-1]TFC12802.1 hypothetical protein E3O35_07785 [Cryobacterium sp. MDB2-A-2]